MTAQDDFALYGGAPVRTRGFTKRTPFSQREMELLAEVIQAQDLFAYGTDMAGRFEAVVCNLYNTPYAVATTSGTAALHAAVGAVELNPGDEVITSPITDIGTVIPILMQNGVPVFADAAPGTLHMDPLDTASKITDRTRAIILVHPAGIPVDVEPFMDLACAHRLILIEDCCQAHAATLQGRYVGTFGHIGCFSMQQSKHITTGDGGFAVTADPLLADKMRRFTDKGRLRRKTAAIDTTERLAPNYRITALQAAVALAQLEKLPARAHARFRLGAMLTELIGTCEDIALPPVPYESKPSYWLFPFFTLRRPATRFSQALRAEGIPAGTGMYIGKPIFLCSPMLYAGCTYGDSHFPFNSPYTTRRYEELYAPGVCPNAEHALQHTVMLPIHEQTTEEEVRDMARAVRKVAAGLKS